MGTPLGVEGYEIVVTQLSLRVLTSSKKGECYLNKTPCSAWSSSHGNQEVVLIVDNTESKGLARNAYVKKVSK